MPEGFEAHLEQYKTQERRKIALGEQVRPFQGYAFKLMDGSKVFEGAKAELELAEFPDTIVVIQLFTPQYLGRLIDRDIPFPNHYVHSNFFTPEGFFDASKDVGLTVQTKIRNPYILQATLRRFGETANPDLKATFIVGQGDNKHEFIADFNYDEHPSEYYGSDGKKHVAYYIKENVWFTTPNLDEKCKLYLPQEEKFLQEQVQIMVAKS